MAMLTWLLHRCRLVAWVAGVLAAAWAGPSAVRAAPPETYVFRYSWGAEGYQFLSPTGIAVGPDKTLFVANRDLNRITRITQPAGAFNVWTGTPQTGLFNQPESVAVDSAGNLYVMSHADQVVKLDSTGAYLTAWGSAGSAPGQFACTYYQCTVAVSATGRVYVVDAGNSRLQWFTSTGQYLGSWGVAGDGRVNCTMTRCGLAVDSGGFVYLADADANRVQRLTADGGYLGQWGSSGSGPGQFDHPCALAIDTTDTLYVLDCYNRRVQVFSPGGVYREEWLVSPDSGGQVVFAAGIAVDSSRTLYLTGDNSVLKFSRTGTYIRSLNYASVHAGLTDFTRPLDIAVGPTGVVYVLNALGNNVVMTDPVGSYLGEWGSSSPSYSAFAYPQSLTISADGWVYVADTYHYLVETYDPYGTFASQFLAYHPLGLSTDPQGNVVWADREHGTLNKNSAAGQLLASTTFAQSAAPFSTVVDGNGQVYASTFAGLIRTDSDLTPTVTVTSTVGDEMAVDAAGNLYLARGAIIKLSPEGALLAQIDPPVIQGAVSTGFRGVWVTAAGELYATSANDHRVYVYSPEYPPLDPESGLVLNGTFEDTAPLQHWRHGGTLPVSHVVVGGSLGSALQLGYPVGATAQGQANGWVNQTVHIPEDWVRPVLTFSYNLRVNDIVDYSEFTATIEDDVGLNLLETLVRAGYSACQSAAPWPGQDLGWATRSADLSAYRGQSIRIVFSARNLWPEALGIWAYVDNVRLMDAGPAAPYALQLPAVLRQAAPVCP